MTVLEPAAPAEGPDRPGGADDRLVQVLEAMPTAFFSLDDRWTFTYVNAAAEQLLGRPRDELLGRPLREVFPDDATGIVETHYRRALETGEPSTFEAWYPQPLNRWYEVRAWPSGDGLSVYLLDITAQRAAEERAENDLERSSLLAAVTTELSGTLDADEATDRLARLLVPQLADWCVVTLVDGGAGEGFSTGLRDAASWHSDEREREVVDRYRALRLPALAEDSFLLQTFATGQPVVLADDATTAIDARLDGAEVRDLLARLAPASAVFLVLPGRDRTVGGISLFRGPGRRAAGRNDVALAQEAAVRAGLAIDNARLFRQQQALAEAFQRSLLTEPPEPDHMQVVVRYEPASEAAQVGGDWYDAFLQADGATVLVIGDVVGHDTAAAAAMGQLRSLLRGIAARTGDGPADVLRGVDEVMALLQVETTATAVVARIEQSVDELARGLTRVRWSNAGHPPPFAVNPDGTVVLLSTFEADLLLGIDPAASRQESATTLDRGATLLLYTDGLVERRGQSLDEGIGQLRACLLDLADRPLDDLCDEILRRMLPADHEDDVALVGVRLHRQDRPRPAEAGPQKVPDVVPPDRSGT